MTPFREPVQIIRHQIIRLCERLDRPLSFSFVNKRTPSVSKSNRPTGWTMFNSGGRMEKIVGLPPWERRETKYPTGLCRSTVKYVGGSIFRPSTRILSVCGLIDTPTVPEEQRKKWDININQILSLRESQQESESI